MSVLEFAAIGLIGRLRDQVEERWHLARKPAHISTQWVMTMSLKFLGKGGSDVGGCPSLYATDHESYLVQGWRTDRTEIVEIPHLLTGFAEPDTFLGAVLTDTGRGTFTLTGQPVTDQSVLCQLDVAANETVIEIPKSERTFYGAVPSE